MRFIEGLKKNLKNKNNDVSKPKKNNYTLKSTLKHQPSCHLRLLLKTSNHPLNSLLEMSHLNAILEVSCCYQTCLIAHVGNACSCGSVFMLVGRWWFYVSGFGVVVVEGLYMSFVLMV